MLIKEIVSYCPCRRLTDASSGAPAGPPGNRTSRGTDQADRAHNLLFLEVIRTTISEYFMKTIENYMQVGMPQY